MISWEGRWADRGKQVPAGRHSLRGTFLPSSLDGILNWRTDRLDLHHDHLTVGGLTAGLSSGDELTGKRRLWPSPRWWNMTFQMTDPTIGNFHFSATGLRPFLVNLDADPDWTVASDWKTFRAVFVGQEQ